MADRIEIELSAKGNAAAELKKANDAVKAMNAELRSLSRISEAAAKETIRSVEKVTTAYAVAQSRIAVSNQQTSNKITAAERAEQAKRETQAAAHANRLEALGIRHSQRMVEIVSSQNAKMTALAAQTNQAMTGFMQGFSGSWLVRGGAVAAGLGAGMLAKAFLGEGLNFNEQMEMARVGIQATLLTVRDFVDATGKSVSVQKQQEMAFAESGRVLKLLQNEAFTTMATMEELVAAFQKLQAGAGTSKATSDEIVRLTGALSNFASANKAELSDVAAQANLALLGVTRTTGKLGAFLRSQGVTPEVLRQWRDAGTAVENLLKIFSQYEKLGPEFNKTMMGVRSNLKDVWDQAAGAFTKPMFEAGRDAGARLVDGMTEEIDKNGKRRISSSLVNALQIAGTVLSGGIETAISGIVSSVDQLMSIFSTGGGVKSILDFVKALIWVQSVAATLREIFTGALVGSVKFFLGELATAVQVVMGFIGINIEAMKTLAKGLGLDWLTDKLTKVGEGVGKIMGAAGAYAKAQSDPFAGIRKGIDAVGESTDKALENIRRLEESINNPVGPQRSKPKTVSGDPEKARKELEAIRDALAVWEAEVHKFDAVIAGAGDRGAQTVIDGIKKKYANIELELAATLRRLKKSIKDKNVLSILDDEFKSMKSQIPDAQARDIGAEYAKLEEDYRQHQYTLNTILKTSEEDQLSSQQESQFKRIESLDNWMNLYFGTIKAGDNMIIEWRRSVAAVSAQIEEYYQVRVSAIEAKKTKDWLQYAEMRRRALVLEGKTLEEAARISMREAADAAYAGANDIWNGVFAGILKIQAGLKDAGQSVADFVGEVWGAVSKGFEDQIFNALIGKAQSFKDMMMGIWSDIARGFAKMVTDIASTQAAKALKKAAFGTEIRDTNDPSKVVGYTGGFLGNNGPDGILGKGAGTYMVGAGVGFGLGSQITGGGGSLVNGLGMSVIGAVAMKAIIGGLASVPIYGWIAAAVAAIAMAAAALFRKSTQEYEGLTGEQIVPGGSTPGQKALNAYGTYLGRFMDLEKMGGGTGLNVLNFMRGGEIRDEFLRSTGIQIGAGSAEDRASLWKQYFEDFFPKTLISMAFGQKATGKFQFLPGIGDNLKGLPGFEKGSWDPNAPIPKMLTGLGFAADKITEIANQIDTRTADEFMTWLNSLVEVVKGFNDLTKDYGAIKTASDAFAVLAGKKNESPATAFATSGEELRASLSTLDILTGDEQIKRAKEIEEALRKRYEAEMQFIAQVQDAMEKFSGQISSDIESMRRSLMTPAEYEANLRSRTAAPDLSGVNSYEKVIELASKSRAAIVELFGILSERLSALKQISADIGDLIGGFKGLRSFSGEQNGTQDFLSGTIDIWLKVGDAARKSGQAQVDALNDIAMTAKERYAQEKALLQEIFNSIRNIKQGISEDVFGYQISNMSDSDKASAIDAEIRRLFNSLSTATSADEVNTTVNRIRSLTGQYYGLFKEGDPERERAAKYAIDIENATGTRAAEVLERLGAKIKEAGDSYAAALASAQTTTANALNNVASELKQLEEDLSALDEIVKTKLTGIVQSVLDTNKGLDEAMKKAKDNFVNVSEVTAKLADGGGKGALDNLDQSARNAAASLNDLAKAARAVSGGGGSGSVTQSDVDASIATNNASMLLYLRNNPDALVA